ncbi:MAG: hypothetical protein OXT09_14930 [Myxococcales bacterium]|nr:hypothetical protein [Myxococcales bacterium]
MSPAVPGGRCACVSRISRYGKVPALFDGDRHCTFYARRERYAGLELPANVVAWLERIGTRPAYVATGGLQPRAA